MNGRVLPEVHLGEFVERIDEVIDIESASRADEPHDAGVGGHLDMDEGTLFEEASCDVPRGAPGARVHDDAQRIKRNDIRRGVNGGIGIDESPTLIEQGTRSLQVGDACSDALHPIEL